MLLICPVRPGDNNEELRYAMRSWQQNLVLPDGLELLTVGYKPSWVSPDHHVEGNRYESVPAAIWDNVILASQFAADVLDAGDALYMNDDFFCMDPMSNVLPIKRDLTLAEHHGLFPNQINLWWPRSLDLTASWLSEQGYPSADSYEVHRPLAAQPRAMLSALNKWQGNMNGVIPQWRTVYGVLNEIEAHPVTDVKLGATVTGIGSPWISTSDASWRKWKRAVMNRFQKPSRWEC